MSDFDLAGFSEAISDRAEAAGPLIVSIGRDRHHSASAFHWRDGLYVAPEEAVDADGNPAVTLPSGETVDAELVGSDAATGIALLRPAATAPGTQFARAADVRLGAPTVIAGRCPDAALAAFGTINEAGPAWRSMRGGLIDRRLGISAALDGRFEGAAAVDVHGALIGMVLFGPRRRPLIVPHATIDRIAPVLVEKGRVGRGYLGAGLHPVRDRTLSGVIIMSLDEDGPARRGGLHVGDVVSAWGGEAISGPRDVIRRLGPDSIGTTVRLTVMRGGSSHQVDVVVGERPSA